MKLGLLGAIQIIRDTFLADFRPPSLPHVTLKCGNIVSYHPHPLPPVCDGKLFDVTKTAFSGLYVV